MANDTKNTVSDEELPPEAAEEAKQEATEEENVLNAEVIPDPDELSEAEEEVKRSPLEERTEECAALKDQLLRGRAEFDNFRKRTARETENIRKTAAAALLQDLLPVLDNLERALAHAEDTTNGLNEGVQLVLGQFHGVLKNRGVEAIPATGESFDPHVHEAIAQLPSADHPAHTVMEEYERGYLMGGQVLRPAKVVVSSGPAEEARPSTAPDPTTDAPE